MNNPSVIRYFQLATIAALLFLGSPLGSPADAQNQGVRQSGTVTSTHQSCWTYEGIVQDCGTSVIPFATTTGVYGIGTPDCVNDVQVTSTTISLVPYHQLCLGYITGDTAAQITLNAFNGAAQIPLDLIINGTTYSIGGLNWLSILLDQQFGSTPGDMLCRGSSYWVALAPGTSGQYLQTSGSTGCPTWVTPGSTFNNPIRIISSGTTDTASSTDGTVAWNSSSSSAKTETIYACAAGVNGKVLILKDEIGTAASYNITITPASGAIDNKANFILNFNLQAVTLQCDGTNSNWMTL